MSPCKRPIERLRETMTGSELSREELERALLAGLLAEDLGEAAVNDPGFQRLIDDVQRILASDPSARALLGRAVAELTGPGADGQTG